MMTGSILFLALMMRDSINREAFVTDS